MLTEVAFRSKMRDSSEVNKPVALAVMFVYITSTTDFEYNRAKQFQAVYLMKGH
jgi:hypothetical protein